MSLYLLLILLPATALAACNEDVIWLLFYKLDTNTDNKVDRSEADALFYAFDINDNGVITLEEVKDRVDVIEPRFQGHEEELINFVDIDEDGTVTRSDVDQEFKLIDTNKDDFKSYSEYADNKKGK